jgi:ubiquinone/menaquinone biosynthesis C-methylase UbiE
VKLRLGTGRLLLGLRGLALLRGWPFGSADEADEHIAAIREIVAKSGSGEDIEIDDPGLMEAYALWSETYDIMLNALIDTEEPSLHALLADIEPGRALDAGSGTGRLARILADYGHDVTAVDASPPMLRRAKEKRVPARCIVGDLRRLPLKNDSVDLAGCALALTHVEELSVPIAELARVVRPGGRVLISDIHPLAVATGAQAFFHLKDGSRGVARNHVHWPSAYVDAATAAGLSVEKMAEPLVDRRFGADVVDPDVRLAIQVSLLGLPLALVWLFRKG